MSTDYKAAFEMLEAAVGSWSENRQIYPDELRILMESILRTQAKQQERRETSGFLDWVLEVG